MNQVQPTYRSAAQCLWSDLRGGRVTPATFSVALGEIAPSERDSWLDVLWNVAEIPPDEAELPRGCVPYLPCPVASVLDAVEHARVSSSDVFIDVGSGLGRAAVLAHLITGAGCIGLEIQTSLARAAQERADSLKLTRVRFVQGDAAETISSITTGTVFFLYCPFSGGRLERFLDGLEGVARARPIRVCCVDMPPLEAPWLARVPSSSMSVDVYRSLFMG